MKYISSDIYINIIAKNIFKDKNIFSLESVNLCRKKMLFNKLLFFFFFGRYSNITVLPLLVETICFSSWLAFI